ncbi:MAG: helix-turn-helix transcriptional regulator [Pseudomonadota bacterium]
MGSIAKNTYQQSGQLMAGDVYGAQRQLRRHLLESSNIRHKPARDLAAHMLLHLDDVTACWSIATRWLRDRLNCQRVDTGFGRPEDKEYFPGFSEAKTSDYDVPSFGGFAVDNRDPIMRAMWAGSRPIVFADIKQDRRVTPKLRKRMAGARTKSKFGAALRTRDGGFGLICADWTEHFVPNEADLFDCFEQTVADVLSPIIAVAKDVAEAQGPQDARAHEAVCLFQYGSRGDGALEALTPAEVEVARLVAQGLSYKEIATVRGRSLSTIDHQLRSIRSKMGVSSTSNLIRLLSNLDGFRI